MCDNMPFPKADVTCPYCWWRGKRHERWREKAVKIEMPGVGKGCPRCGKPVSDGWIYRTVA